MNILGSLSQLFNRPQGRGVADLARWLAVPEPDLRAWLSNAPAWSRGYDYARFSVPKRRGGVRQISAPTEKLKALQRRVLARLLNGLPVNAAATGFVPGRSIVDNANPHTGRGVVINLDLADFFPSLSAARVESVFRGVGWDAEAARILARICTDGDQLPQGAPTSPALSNLVCRRLDARLSGLARHYDGAYTRYADDITFSFPTFGRNKRRRPGPKRRTAGYAPRPAKTVSRALLSWVRQIIEEEGFKIQFKKRVRVQRPHQRQTATGLVVNRQVALPRATRRLIRAMQHRQRLGRLDEAGQRRLRGLEALLKMVEKQRGKASG